MISDPFKVRTTGSRIALPLLCGVGMLLFASPAAARSWSRESLPSGIGSLNGIDCVGVTGGGHCVAVGQNSTGTGPVAVVSTDAGKTWTAESLPSGVAGLFAVSCSSVSRCWAVGEADTSGDHAAIVGTENGGASWSREAVPLLPGGFSATALQKVSCVGQRCLTTGIRNGAVLRTVDGGSDWSARALPQGCKGFCPAFTADTVTLKSPTVGYAGGGNQCGGHVSQCSGMIWKTTNGGASWKIAFRGSPFVDAVSCVDTSHCWAAAATFKTGEIFGTASAGKHWRRQTVPGFGGFFNHISCLRGNHDRCVAVGENERGNRPVIAATADGGSHWQLGHTASGTGPLYGVSMLGVTARAVGQNPARTSGLALTS